jgi:hypothetical protein
LVVVVVSFCFVCVEWKEKNQQQAFFFLIIIIYLFFKKNLIKLINPFNERPQKWLNVIF